MLILVRRHENKRSRIESIFFFVGHSERELKDKKPFMQRLRGSPSKHVVRDLR